ncbi:MULTISPECIES: hypothetical protein [Nocardiaceae]|uniref:hypothetical protein n=1 Tax=Nocardiaceae TaxID=85025 RepID=UPI000AB4EB1F|nr:MULTISPECIES: hypothetical protein [Rhodococcus]
MIVAFWRRAGRGVSIAGLAPRVIEALTLAVFVYGAGEGLTSGIPGLQVSV